MTVKIPIIFRQPIIGIRMKWLRLPPRTKTVVNTLTWPCLSDEWIDWTWWPSSPSSRIPHWETRYLSNGPRVTKSIKGVSDCLSHWSWSSSASAFEWNDWPVDGHHTIQLNDHPESLFSSDPLWVIEEFLESINRNVQFFSDTWPFWTPSGIENKLNTIWRRWRWGGQKLRWSCCCCLRGTGPNLRIIKRVQTNIIYRHISIVRQHDERLVDSCSASRAYCSTDNWIDEIQFNLFEDPQWLSDYSIDARSGWRMLEANNNPNCLPLNSK